MAVKSQYVQVGKRKLEISNLSKVLYPKDNIVKAEILEYYLSIAPTILKHIKGRALSLIRFPDGIEQERFFQKNRPEWAPDWLEYVSLGVENTKDYIMATEDASLVWLANMACLELHQMHARKPHHNHPDYIVYDLDPPEQFDFEELKSIAIQLKNFTQEYGYECFVKTTGGRGLHLLTPINPKFSFQDCFEAAKDLATSFIVKQPRTTLNIKKDARKGRVLIDIYRNRSSQTIVAPYSLRGIDGAPVSMPITWDELPNVENSQAFNIQNAKTRVLQMGDPWAAIDAYATDLHTLSVNKSSPKKLADSSHRKTPQQLAEYSKKRDFFNTPEPEALYSGGDGNGFVVHKHHASHIHYDLRLEQEGVLKSWAVPRGLPPVPGVKRLAVQTEDHPLEYITFEGEIPKGQYGGGKMWIYANGRYEITKQKKDGFYFTLSSPQMSGEYRMHQMNAKEWLLERVDQPQINLLEAQIEPMLASSGDHVPQGEEYGYELKWDGIRCIVVVDDEKVDLWSRNHQNLNKQFPELLQANKALKINNGVFDGEIVCFDKTGKPDFKAVIKRMQKNGNSEIERASKANPAYCYLFDALYLDGRSIMSEPLSRRKQWLYDIIRHSHPYRASEVVFEGQELYDATIRLGLEGIMAKNLSSQYRLGKRSSDWMKIKSRKTADAVIIGYTEGKGDRSELFGALHLGQFENGVLHYRGKVGTGFNDKVMSKILKQLKKLVSQEKLVEDKILDEAQTTWIRPELYCEIQYSMITGNGYFREPVFLRLRPDL